MISRSRNNIQTRFRRKMKNEKRDKHKTRNEKVMDDQFKYEKQTESGYSEGPTLCGENLKKRNVSIYRLQISYVLNDRNKSNEEMLVKGRNEFSTTLSVCKLG